MDKLAFPLNYFSQIFTPKRAFKGRKSLTKFQIILIFIFTTSLLLIPVTLNLAKSTNFDLVQIMPGTFKELDAGVLSELQASQWQGGALQETSSRYLNEQETVGFNVPQKKIDSWKNGVSFNQGEMFLKDKSGYDFRVTYTKEFNPTTFKTVAALKTGISAQWLKQNRAFVMFTMILMSAALILVSNLILVFGGAVFVWLSKKNSASSIKSYQESVNLMLNAIGLGSLISMILGLIYFDMTIVLSVQSLGLVVMLLAIFVSTRFNDDYPREAAVVEQNK